MHWFYGHGVLIETAAAAVFIVPVFLFGRKLLFKSRNYTLLYTLFGLYIAAICALVGFPNITTLTFDLNVNLIPFLDMLPDFKNACLNVLLFTPFGAFLPVLWPDFRSWKCTALAGLTASCMIEAAQIFTYRTTDINDLITNTLGAVIGYWLAKRLTGRFCRYAAVESDRRDLYVICVAVVLIMFLLQPPVASVLWGMVL